MRQINEFEIHSVLSQYLHQGEQLRNWCLGGKGPSTATHFLVMPLFCLGVLPGIVGFIILAKQTKRYVVGLTDRRLLVLRFRGRLNIDGIFEYRLDSLPFAEAQTGTNPKIKLHNPTAPFEAVFLETSYFIPNNGNHARAIAIELSSRTAGHSRHPGQYGMPAKPSFQVGESCADSAAVDQTVEGQWAPLRPALYEPVPSYQQPQTPAPADEFSASYASVGSRCLAALIDWALGTAAALPGFVLMITGGTTADRYTARGQSAPPEAGLLILLGMLLFFGGGLAFYLYNAYLLGREGASLGKRWLGITVLDTSGQPLGFGRALLREIIKSLLGIFCLILLLWPLWDREKQGLYDKAFQSHAFAC